MFHFGKIIFYFSDDHEISSCCCRKSFVMAKGLLLLFLLIGNVAFCQMGQPQTPQYQNTQPTYYPDQRGNVQMGATANDIINQQNRRVPFYGGGTDVRANQQMTQAAIFEQMRNDPAYNPQLRNPNSRHFRLTPNEELLNMFGSIAPAQLSENYSSKDFESKTVAFKDALNSLKGMLAGKHKLSVAEAYFTMENAYGESYLTKQEFLTQLNQSCDFIKVWMAQNGLDNNDNVAKHYAIQKFISERLYITVTKQEKDKEQELQTVIHDPFFYDFNNYTGEKDHRDFYVTKCIATGMGQCNSLTTLYLCIAEGLGAKTYLAFAPQHALVKFRDNKGDFRNYEATSNWNITDKWYLDNLFVSRTAQKAGVFLAPYDDKQQVANCILDLAFGYQRRFGAADGKFIEECIKAAKPYFPKNNNANLYITYSNMYGNQLGKVMKENKILRVEDAVKNPKAKVLYDKWRANENIVEALGYNNDPPGLYEEMMKHYEFRGREQQKLHLDGKKKHDLFTAVKK
jgi:hypothetical protein